ncbi:glycoside hydrolase, partial [Dipodascopsis uninucleata]
MMGDQKGFESAIKKIERFVHFDIPSRVQVFETTIRMLGGLLSGHILATSPALGHKVEGYDGSLLRLAADLGDRLIPAFDTPTGIPMARVNLQRGYPLDNITETCSAGAGSLILEFATLSRLTGDDKYESAARKAFFAIWDRRSALNLIGTTIDSITGLWTSAYSGIGASVDSFYEYALKAYILLDDKAYLDVFAKSYSAIKDNMLDNWLYKNVHIVSGGPVTMWIDSLAAFFPGLQVLCGDLDAAIKSHLVYYKLWMTYGGIPERWNYVHGNGSIELGWYGLRPEFVESNYLLYRATKDPFYLHVGAQILSDIQARARVSCGFASIHDVRTVELEDRMESFFLSETLKYLYLLFDVDNPLNNEGSNFIFSTEAHVLKLDIDILSKEQQKSIKAKSLSSVIPRQNGLPHRPETISKETKVSKVSSFKSKLASKFKSKSKTKGSRSDFNSRSPFYSSLVDSFLEGPYSPATGSKGRASDAAGKDLEYINIISEIMTCQCMPQEKTFFSRVLSWDEFYHLDGLYNFVPIQNTAFPPLSIKNIRRFSSHSPDYSKNVRPLSNGTILYNRPIIDNVEIMNPYAQSMPIRTTAILELFFPADSQPQIAFKGRDVEVPSFDGYRVRLSKVDSSRGNSGLRILAVGGVKVLGNVKVHNIMSRGLHDQDIVQITRNGRVKIQGEDVLNLIV